MDPFSIALGALKFGIAAVGMAQKSGMLGGSTDFGPYLDDIQALYGNFTKLVGTFTNSAVYDSINAMDQDAKVAFIYSHILLEGMDAKDERIRREMGL